MDDLNNDPLDRTDPAGLDCKPKGGTTTCDSQVTGSHTPKTISFKTPKGVAEGTLRSSSLAEHHYSYPTPHHKFDSAVRGGLTFSDTGISNGMDAPARHGIRRARVEVLRNHSNRQERPR